MAKYKDINPMSGINVNMPLRPCYRENIPPTGHQCAISHIIHPRAPNPKVPGSIPGGGEWSFTVLMCLLSVLLHLALLMRLEKSKWEAHGGHGHNANPLQHNMSRKPQRTANGRYAIWIFSPSKPIIDCINAPTSRTRATALTYYRRYTSIPFCHLLLLPLSSILLKTRPMSTLERRAGALSLSVRYQGFGTA